MEARLADSLDLVLPALPPELVPPDKLPALRSLAAALAPTIRCGFEVRLGDSASEVDFQQGVLALPDERERLRAHISPDGPWNGVGELLDRWLDASSPLSRGIEALWLEFDRPPLSSLSVFVGLDRSLADPAGVAYEALDALAGRAGWARSQDALGRCIGACPDGAYVSHLGLMLGRAAPFLRVNVKRLEPGDLEGYLREVGWPGRPDAAVELMRELHPLVDGVAVCLDVGAHVQPRLGFECHLEGQPPAEARWARFLDELVARGWCTARKRDALLAWPGLVVPEAGAGAWPAHILREALLHPPDDFTTLERRLNHVKVTYEPGATPAAKGYFGFLHRWLQPGLDGDEPERATAVRRGGGTGVPGCLEAGTSFLLASRTSAGWWRDFAGSGDWNYAARWSDAWVTAFAGVALAGIPDRRARAAAERAWRLLVERQAADGGWSYNRAAPTDADSTAWVLRLAAALGHSASRAPATARLALERHILPGAGLTTYTEDACPGPGVPALASPDGSGDGWCRTVHACVTAAAATVALNGEPLRESLRRTQAADGSWAPYWWEDREYATALAAEALAATGRRGDRDRVDRAVAWVLRQPADSSAFASAWQVRVLRLADTGIDARERLDRSVGWLVESQDGDGGWPASARLRWPRQDVTDADAIDVGGLATRDDSRIFTTGTVLTALAGATP
jgi:hypothetical protein